MQWQWQLADASAAACAAVVDALARVGRAERGSQHGATWTLLDTFDERLAEAGLVFEARQRSRATADFHLRAADAPSGEHWRGAELPRTVRDVPRARVAARLSRVCAGRALLPICAAPVALQVLHWRDALDKRIASVEILRVEARGDSPALLFVVVQPVRGDERACARLLAACRRDALAAATPGDPARVLRAARGGPRYRAKPLVELHAAAPAGAALAALFAAYGEVLWSNERGIVEDLDTEFLHDYRVALRSLRSWTTDLRKVMSKSLRAQIKGELAALNRATGRLRDLDMLSASLPAYIAALGGIAPDAAARLTKLVATARADAQRALVAHLKSAEYRRFRRRWPRLCRQLAEGRHRGRDGKAPLLEVVTAALRRRREEVVGFDWTRAEDDPAVLHELRKECKKLRYLLEGFQRLFDAARCRRAIAELKQVQTAMGDTWDLHVHHALLETLAAPLPAADARTVLPVVLGLGARLTALEHAHVELVSRAFARFRTADVQRIYSRLIERP